MLRKAIYISTFFLLGVTAIGGLLHLPAARPLLATLGVKCPQRANPDQVEHARLTSARQVRGDTPAPLRFALGFRLDQATKQDD